MKFHFNLKFLASQSLGTFFINMFRFIYQIARVLDRWLRTHGVKTTLIWLYARATPLLTGRPLIKYSQITPVIYIGAQYNQYGKRRLERLGVNGCVNMRAEFDDVSSGLALEYYCFLPTLDKEAPTIPQLIEGIHFINQTIAKGGKVYIHCRSGVGRAPTMAAAYFISQGTNVDQAIQMIRKVRPFIDIKSNQMKQLRQLEAIIREAE